MASASLPMPREAGMLDASVAGAEAGGKGVEVAAFHVVVARHHVRGYLQRPKAAADDGVLLG